MATHLTLAETCRRLGVTRKALRLYESHGLLTPGRTGTDWRVYGPEQIARLHQILALKRFGLPLNRIADILKGKVADIAAMLDVHAGVIQDELKHLHRAASLVRAAQTRLAARGSLSTDDLIFLTKETVMTEPRNPVLSDIFENIADKHLSADDRSALAKKGFDMLQPDIDWPALHAEAQRLMEIGDPTSLAAMDLAQRWMAKVFEATGGDPALTRKVMDVARNLHDDPAFAAASTSSNPMMDFVQKAYGAAITAGLMPTP